MTRAQRIRSLRLRVATGSAGLLAGAGALIGLQVARDAGPALSTASAQQAAVDAAAQTASADTATQASATSSRGSGSSTTSSAAPSSSTTASSPAPAVPAVMSSQS